MKKKEKPKAYVIEAYDGFSAIDDQGKTIEEAWTDFKALCDHLSQNYEVESLGKITSSLSAIYEIKKKGGREVK